MKKNSIAQQTQVTDFKYNKRNSPPEASSINRESLHQVRGEEMLRVFKSVAKKSIKIKENKQERMEAY